MIRMSRESIGRGEGKERALAGVDRESIGRSVERE